MNGLPPINLFPKDVGKAPILSIMGAKRLRIPAIPSVGLALHDGSNLRLIIFIVGLSYGYPLKCKRPPRRSNEKVIRRMFTSEL